jgi:NitT/TauT family transport system substrate-binding protein
MRRKVAALMAVPLLLAAGCGGSGSSTGATASGDDGLDAVTVGVLPTVDVAPIYLGRDKGFFADQGIELTLEQDQGGASVIPGVVNDTYQFGFSNIASLLLAAQQLLPLQIIANGAASNGVDGADYSAVVTRPGSGIASAADLAGKRVAVNTPNNIGTTTINESVRKAGGDPDDIHYVAMPFPDMPKALAEGDVDAIWAVEPFLSVAKMGGATVLASNFVDTAAGLTVAAYFTNKKLAAEDPDLVERFTTALDQSLDYATAHEDEARAVVGSYAEGDETAAGQSASGSSASEPTVDVAQIDPAVFGVMTLPVWPKEINRASVERLAQLEARDHLLDGVPDLDAVLP